MSSILTALKKLENESSQKVEIQPGLGKIDLKQVIHYPAKRARFFRITLLTLCGIVIITILAAGGFYMGINGFYLNNTGKQPATAKQINAVSQKDKTSATSISMPIKNNPGKSKASTRKRKVSFEAPRTRSGRMMETTETKILSNTDGNAEYASPKNSTRGMVETETMQKMSTEPSTVLPDKKGTAASPSVEKEALSDIPDPDSQTSLPTEKKIHAEIKMDSRFTLQAISWGSDPETRLAVINNRILREGAAIEGVTILRIEPDGIIFQDGDDKWLQEFRIR